MSINVSEHIKICGKKLKCTDIFSPSFYTHECEAECTHSECKQHMEIVNTSAEGAILMKM